MVLIIYSSFNKNYNKGVVFMFFSVIIPVYNRPDLINQAIQSVIDQDYQDWECIVVDDASTDDTAKVCLELAKNDSRIRVFSFDKNHGVSAARNFGLNNLTRDDGCILFLDSDDRLVPNAMSSLSLVFGNNDIDMAVFAFDQQGLPFDPPYNRVLDRAWIHSNAMPQHLNIIPHSTGFLQPFAWNKCYKSSLIMKYTIRFDEWRKTWEDNAFVIRCLDKCEHIMIIPDMLYELCNYTDADHLSRHIDSELFFSYIAGYDKNVEQFGKEYDFCNDYTRRHFYGVINRTLLAYCNKCDEEEYNNLLKKLTENKTFNEWVSNIVPQDKSEEEIISAVKNGDHLALADIYRELSNKQKETKQISVTIMQRAKRILKRLLKSE